MHWYLEPWKKYADFSGRARRKEYWLFGLFNLIIVLVLVAIAWLLGGFNTDESGASMPSTAAMPVFVLYAAFCLAIVVPSLAVTVRRLHDSGRSGWWYFISFIPLGIGAVWMIVLMCLDSEPGSNQWGPNPKEIVAVAAPV